MANNNGCLASTKRAIAFVLAIVLFLSLPIALLATDVARVVFSPSRLIDVLTARLVDSGLIQAQDAQVLFSGEFLQGTDAGGGEFQEALGYLSDAERGDVIETLIPSPWIESQIQGMVTNLFVWIDDDRPSPGIFLDLQPLKAHLTEGGIDEIVDTIVDSWPSCSPQDVDLMRSELAQTGETPIFLCEPPEPLRTQVIGTITSSFFAQLRELPPVLNLQDEQGAPEPAGQAIQLKNQIRSLRGLMLWGWLLPLSLLGLIMALVIRSWKQLSRWWGIPLLLSGISTILLLFLTASISEDWFQSLLQDLRTESEIFSALLNVAYGGISEEVFGLVFFHGLITAGAGLLLWLSGRVVKGKSPVTATRAPKPSLEIDRTPSGDPSTFPPPPPVASIDVTQDNEGADEDPPSGIFG